MRSIFYLIALFFVVSIFCLFHFDNLFSDSLWPDEALYAWISQQFSAHPASIFSKEALAYQSPLFPVILSLGSFWGEGMIGYHAITLAFSLIGIVGIYLLGRLLVNECVGLFAAIALSFNPTYFSGAGRILIDVPVTTVIIFFMIALVIWGKSGFDKKHVFIVSVLAVLSLLLKWPGGLVIIPLSYYCFSMPKKQEGVNSFRIMSIPLIAMAIAALIIFYLSYWRFGKLLPIMHVFEHAFVKQPLFYYLKYYIKFTGSYFVGFLSIFGVLSVLLLKDFRHLRVLLVWLLSFMFVISFAQEKQFRYGLIYLPASLLLAGIGLDALIKNFIKGLYWRTWAHAFFIVVLIMVGLLNLDSLIRSQQHKMFSYSGFREAGQWLLSNAQNGQVWVGSERALRYYTNIKPNQSESPFKKFAFLPHSLDQIKGLGNEFLVVDRWEYIQPSWIFPITHEKLSMLLNNGFVLAKVIYKPLFLSDGSGLKVFPVIWILKRNSR